MTGFGVELLGWTEQALDELGQLRGWTEEAIERLALEWDEREHRVVFTVTDETACTVGRLRYLADPTQRSRRNKMLADEGSIRQLFPAPETLGDDVDELVLGEGEPDTVAAWSAGLTAVGVPGTQGWQPQYAARLAGRHWTVYIVFDCDTQGRKAATEVADSLAQAGVDARIVDLVPGRDDGYDLTEYLRDHGVAELRRQLASAPPHTPQASSAAIVFEPLRAFLARKLPPAESLVGTVRNGTNLLPRYGWVMPWGREGSGKTSVLVDLLYHAAAGLDWQHYPVARPLRLVAIINEGVPGGLQDKLAQKLELWNGGRELILDNLAIYASPWGEFSFRNQKIVEHAHDYAQDFQADYVALDPLHTLGTSGAGAPQETEEFKNRLRDFGLWDTLGIITAHHSNKNGMVSGDWARHPDTVLRLEKDGQNPATKITLEKARPADPAELGVPMLLEWNIETMGYRRVALAEHEIVPDSVLLERVIAYLAEQPAAVGITQLRKDVQGDYERLSAVVKAAVSRGQIVDESTRADRYAFRLVSQPTRNDTRQEQKPAQTRMETEVSSSVEATNDG